MKNERQKSTAQEITQDPVYAIVKERLGFDYLYPHQILFISLILEAAGYYGPERAAEAARANLAILPTGAGKTLCFCVPALILPGISLIVYPLKSLISDQERRFKAAGINCSSYHGGLEKNEKTASLQRLKSGSIKALLVNPEAFLDDRFFSAVQNSDVRYVYVDEAHTVCEWGESFRPACLEMARRLAGMENILLTALTATAGDRVLRGIIDALFPGGRVHVLRGNPNKENIHYSVIPTLCKDQTIRQLVMSIAKPAIIFCSSRTGSEMTARMIRNHFPHTEVRFYHAGLSREEKAAIESWFAGQDDAILVSTCAFGLGIDISGIRTVIHYILPLTPEAFVQESGRGGRDRKPAVSISLLSPADIRFFKKSKARIMPLVKAFIDGECRRNAVLSFFGQEAGHCTGCDCCDGEPQTEPEAGRQLLGIYCRWRQVLGESGIEAWISADRDLLKSYPFLKKTPVVAESRFESREMLSNLELVRKNSLYLPGQSYLKAVKRLAAK